MQDLVKQIFEVDEAHFNALALQVFDFQYQHISIYRSFCDMLQKTPQDIEHYLDIPCLPISFFKTHKLIHNPLQKDIVFKSSGTGGTRSQHFVEDVSVYQRAFQKGFKHFYSKSYCVLALLPGYIENGDSSLVYMCQSMIEHSPYKESGFYLNTPETLQNTLKQLKKSNTPTLLIGVTHALLDFAEHFPTEFPELIVMETGGMKGKGPERTRSEVHEVLKKGFSVAYVHSEYGMTELLSQAYSKEQGLFQCPPWMKVWTREINDPFQPCELNQTGCLNIIDLANVYSVSFIATDDLSKKHSEGFEVLGRLDHSDLRGCNLLI